MYTIFEWVIGNQSPDFKEKGHESQIKTSFFGSDFGFSGEPLLTALKIYIGKLCCLLADFYGFVETLCSLFIHKSRSSSVLWLLLYAIVTVIILIRFTWKWKRMILNDII